jgi:hypothetical protein
MDVHGSLDGDIERDIGALKPIKVTGNMLQLNWKEVMELV